MSMKTETFPLKVTKQDIQGIADKISRHIDAKRKKGLKFVGGIPVDWLCSGGTKNPVPMQYIMMSYEGEK